jgi:hypothetical protein
MKKAIEFLEGGDAVTGELSNARKTAKKYEATALVAGFTSGGAYVAVDELQRAHQEGWGKVAAVIGLCSIAAVLHCVGAVERDRFRIVGNLFRASIYTIVGAGVASLLVALAL